VAIGAEGPLQNVGRIGSLLAGFSEREIEAHGEAAALGERVLQEFEYRVGKVASEAVGEDDTDALAGGPPLRDTQDRRDFRYAADGLVKRYFDFFEAGRRLNQGIPPGALLYPNTVVSGRG